MSLKNLSISLVVIFAIGFIGFISKGENKIEKLDSTWGMGTEVTEAVSNDREYEWYVDQMDTGRNAEMNCGPAVVEMIAKWLNENSGITTEEVVDRYIYNEGKYVGVGYNELQVWLKEYGIDAEWLYNVEDNKIKEEIDKGSIVIAALDMKELTYNPVNRERVGTYFDFKGVMGSVWHCVIVKGYKVVEGKLYFETYDPYSFDCRYEDGSLIGKNRYYSSEEFINGVRMFFPDVLLIKGNT